MLDLKFVRENPDIVKQNIKNKFQDSKLPLVDEVIALDAENRTTQKEADDLRASRNKLSKQIGALMGQGKKEEAEAVKAQVDAAAAAATAPRKKTKSGVYIKGIGDTDVRFSKCCGPVPGDEIVGFVTRGRGVSIHRTDCVNIINLSEEERARLLEAEWSVPLDNKGEANYSAEIRVFAPNRDGLTVDILKVLVDDGVPVLNVNARALKNDSAVIDLSMKIKGKEQLEFICKKILQISGVDRIERVTT